MDLPFLNQLASNGLLGVMLAISLFVNWYFFKIIQKQNDKMVENAKEITDKLLEPIDQIKRNGELLTTLFQNFLSRKGKL